MIDVGNKKLTKEFMGKYNISGRRMVAKIPKKIWNERNIWKTHTKYGGNGMTEIQHTVSSVEMSDFFSKRTQYLCRIIFIKVSPDPIYLVG